MRINVQQKPHAILTIRIFMTVFLLGILYTSESFSSIIVTTRLLINSLMAESSFNTSCPFDLSRCLVIHLDNFLPHMQHFENSLLIYLF